jgi:hypothetical protein
MSVSTRAMGRFCLVTSHGHAYSRPRACSGERFRQAKATSSASCSSRRSTSSRSQCTPTKYTSGPAGTPGDLAAPGRKLDDVVSDEVVAGFSERGYAAVGTREEPRPHLMPPVERPTLFAPPGEETYKNGSPSTSGSTLAKVDVPELAAPCRKMIRPGTRRGSDGFLASSSAMARSCVESHQTYVVGDDDESPLFTSTAR